MLHHQKTFEREKKESEKMREQYELEIPILHTDVIRKMDYVFIVAKTWGAAKQFYDKTELHRIDKINKVKQIQFLKNVNQLHKNMNKTNTVIILLSRYDENEDNLEIIKQGIKQGLYFLNYKAV